MPLLTVVAKELVVLQMEACAGLQSLGCGSNVGLPPGGTLQRDVKQAGLDFHGDLYEVDLRKCRPPW